MNSGQTTRPDVSQIMAGLKGFQRDTVEFVYRRLYTDPDPVSRFLIADEVGLGKTLVARGVIAKAVDHLWKNVERIDVVYICSNQDIAQQNIDRLNVTRNRTFQHASRATLLPIRIQQLKTNKLNFVSLTPNTSFNISSHGGWAWERVVLFNILRKTWQVSDEILSNVLRGEVRQDNWDWYLSRFEQTEKIDGELATSFIGMLDQNPDLRVAFENIAGEIGPQPKKISWEVRSARDRFTGSLRRLLAKSSLAALDPDLIILDEFQRFKYLLEEDNEFALLARELFDFRGANGQPAKVILLSATPYKMYTLQGEEGENHYEDFFRTISFLLNYQNDAVEKLRMAIEQYQLAFLGVNTLDDAGKRNFHRAKASIEHILRQVMVRTERLAASEDRNGMLVSRLSAQKNLHPMDLVNFVRLDQLAQLVDADDQVEYWKSSAYPLNLMEEYKLKRQFERACKQDENRKIYDILRSDEAHLLNWEDIQAYKEIDPGNARMRALHDQTVATGNWQLLWLPANLPYYAPEGPYADLSEESTTKSLVFSSWRVVPKVIATILSYEAEQHIFGQDDQGFNYDELTQKRKALLRFAFSRGRFTGMSVFTLIYPCATLALELDPLFFARQSAESGYLISSFFILENIKIQLRRLLDKATSSIPVKETGPVDESWYWFAPLLLDRHFHREAVSSWFYTDENDLMWEDMLDHGSNEEDESSFADHVSEFKKFFENPIGLGRKPRDLLDVLARICLASPAVTSLRAISRVLGINKSTPQTFAAAASASLGFRTLFNQPDAISLLQLLDKEKSDDEKVYWRSILNYCVQGNIQSVLDEYLHVLYESLGLASFHDIDESSMKLGETLQQALSLRSPSLRFDEINLDRQKHSISIKGHSIRCRYAIRFGDNRSEALERGMRDTDVRIAFNSPFKPFVLATTSIGQEGLDFHQYCHRVIHWNLPLNPVDLEQREGRVHRYKGHVIRRNLAEHFNLNSVLVEKGKLTDPWQQLFELARKDDAEASNGLVPYWVYEKGHYRIERYIPVLPLSREYERLESLTRALVAYRSVIGQPRQQEMLESLTNRFSSADEIKEFTKQFIINLSPPHIEQ